MRRPVLRILLNAATVLSLVLCVGAMAAWVRSYRASDLIWWPLPNQGLLSITTHRGGLLTKVLTSVGPSQFSPPLEAGWQRYEPVRYTDAVDSQDTFVNRLGFALDDRATSSFSMRLLACPYWFIMLLTATLPAARLVGWQRRRRARRLRMGPGCCQHCGYDCRATPDRCPECGTAR
jgi:hypothetical protein